MVIYTAIKKHIYKQNKYINIKSSYKYLLFIFIAFNVLIIY